MCDISPVCNGMQLMRTRKPGPDRNRSWFSHLFGTSDAGSRWAGAVACRNAKPTRSTSPSTPIIRRTRSSRPRLFACSQRFWLRWRARLAASRTDYGILARSGAVVTSLRVPCAWRRCRPSNTCGGYNSSRSSPESFMITTCEPLFTPAPTGSGSSRSGVTRSRAS